MFYVYEWFIIDTNEVFYVGKGCGDRYKTLRRNRYFLNIYNKYSCDVRIVKSKLTEQESFNEEIRLINHYKSIGQAKANLTLGGEGCTGYKHTTETLKRLSNSHLGINNPMFGKTSPMLGRKFSEETRIKMSKNHYNCNGENNPMFNKGYFVSGERNHFFNKKHTNETKDKMKKNHANFKGRNHPQAINVYVYLNNKEIKSFSAVVECAQWLVDNGYCNTFNTAKQSINRSIANNKPYKKLEFKKEKK